MYFPSDVLKTMRDLGLRGAVGGRFGRRRALMMGVILGAEAFMAASAAEAAGDISVDVSESADPVTQSVNVTTRLGEVITAGERRDGIAVRALDGATSIAVGGAVTGDNGIFATSRAGDINITTARGATVTGTAGLGTAGAGIWMNSSAGGAASIIFDGAVLGSDQNAAIYARGTTGALFIGGAGDARLLNNAGVGGGINAGTTTGALTLSGSGAASAVDGPAATLGINSSAATSDLVVNRSGAFQSLNGDGIDATNAGMGKVTITGIGPVTASKTGIFAQTWSGLVDMSLTRNVSGDSGVIASTYYGSIAIRTASGANVTGRTNGIMAFGNVGSISINADGAVTGGSGPDGAAIVALTNSGPITVSGAGRIDGRVDLSSYIIAGAHLTLSGTGDISAQSGAAASLFVSTPPWGENGQANIVVNRSGAFEALAGRAINAVNESIGNIAISGLGAVTAHGGDGIYASAKGGAIDIGGSAGLGRPVFSDGGDGIRAEAGAAGAISIRTGSGGDVTSQGGFGIATRAVDGATAVSIGAGSTITGRAGALSATTTNGAVAVANAGAVKGSIVAERASGGTGTFIFDNSGTLALLGQQFNSGFSLNNLSGGVLTGTGAFGAVTAAAGSLIQVGDRTLATPAMGTMAMSSLTMAAGSKLEVRADASGANDRLNVAGAANIAGGTLRVLASPQTEASWIGAKSFTVLSAGSLSGEFAAAETDYAFLKVTATRSGATVVATLERNATPIGAYSATPTQKSVSDVFETFQTQGSNPLIAKVTALTAEQAPVAMSQLSGTGVVAASTQSFSSAGVFTSAINAEMGKFTGSAGGGASVLSYAEDTKLTKAFDTLAVKPVEPIRDGRFWAHVLGGVATMKSDATNPSERSSNYGIAAGADTALTPNLRVGFALSGGQSTTKVAALATKADATWGHGALYGVATDGDRYAKAAVVYGRVSTETSRTVTAFPAAETAKGKFGANLFSTRLEVGQTFAMGRVDLTPLAAFEPSWLVQDSYAETGAATIGLGFNKRTTRALPATLGLKAKTDIMLAALQITPSATLGWVHDFARASSLSPFFTALPGATFTVPGAQGDRNLARLELNVEATPTGSMATFYASARADLGARTTSVRGTAGFMMRF